MTTITYAPPGIIYPDAIKLRGGTIAPGAVEPGEFYLDEEHRLLYLETDAGLQGVPLDVLAVPPLIDRTANDSLVMVRTATGTAWDELAAGGGGTIYDAGAYRVPGLTPTALGSLVLPGGSGGQAIFEMPQPGTLTAIAARAKAGTGTVTFTLCEWDGALGAVLANQGLSFATVEAKTANLLVPLDAGYYAWTWTSSASLTLETVQGYLSWSTEPESHPVFMQIS